MYILTSFHSSRVSNSLSFAWIRRLNRNNVDQKRMFKWQMWFFCFSFSFFFLLPSELYFPIVHFGVSRSIPMTRKLICIQCKSEQQKKKKCVITNILCAPSTDIASAHAIWNYLTERECKCSTHKILCLHPIA